LLDHNQEKLDSLVRGLNLPSERLYTCVVDLLDAQTLRAKAEAVAAKFGAVHGLIHLYRPAGRSRRPAHRAAGWSPLLRQAQRKVSIRVRSAMGSARGWNHPC